MKNVTRVIVGAALLGLLALAATPVASAKDGDVRAVGSCTKSTTSKIKLSEENGRIEVEFEVDQNRNGVTWKVTLRRHGSRAVTTNATTTAPSGSFSVERRLPNGGGSDKITARATSPSGEVCTATVTI